MTTKNTTILLTDRALAALRQPAGTAAAAAGVRVALRYLTRVALMQEREAK